MKLSDQQIKVIQNVITQSHVEIRTLGEDLLDHLCCAIEQRMETSESFDIALEESLHELAPDGLDKIQHETIYLLTFDKHTHMKKAMYFIGLITAISMSLGFTFRMMHWPGGIELINYGFYGFAFIFIPIVALTYLKENSQATWSDKVRVMFGLASGVIVGAGLALKFSAIQGADLLILGGSLFFTFLFLPLLFFSLYKKAVVS